MSVLVQEEDIDIGAELAEMTVGNHAIGGLGVFVGLVRDIAGEAAVAGMTLEHYPGMTERQLEAIEADPSWQVTIETPTQARIAIPGVG